MSSTEIRSYMIYNPVYRQIRKYIKRNGYRNYIVNTWNVCLDKSNDLIDTKLIWVKGDDQNFINFMDELTEMSDCFYFWSKSPSVSIEVDRFSLLKEIIDANKLWSYIEKIQTINKLSLFRDVVKVITFHPRILSAKVLALFSQLRSYYDHKRTFYIHKAYGWLTPSGLSHFKQKIRYRYTHVVIYLLLDYYRKWLRRRNIRVLNLFDLCSLRLAMFDPRYYQFDQCELPGLIHTELRHIVECEKKLNPKYQFDTMKYFIEQGIESVPPVVAEFIMIYISDYTDSVPNSSDITEISYSHIVYVGDYIRLYGDKLYEDVIIDFIRKRPFLELSIMSASQAITPHFLEKIIHFQNVSSVSVNVNFPMAEFEPIISANTLEIDKPIAIVLEGDNEINYLENYIACLKPHTSSREIILHVQCIVPDYTNFKGIVVNRINFFKQEINTSSISELSQNEQTISTRYEWQKATLVKNVEVLKMLQEFKLVENLDIVQDENTLETIFRFIEDMFQTHNCTTLEFGSDLIPFNITIPYVTFNKYIFSINGEGNKIDMYSKNSKKIVDLFDIMFQTNDSTESYDFYQ